ncbi:MAG: MlaD family protein [Qingshengfaniella sp.]
MSHTDPAELPLDPKGKRSGSVSLVWLVPLAALAIALYIAWQSYAARGPLIEVTFDSAEGIVANSTVLKYREVDVGVVEDVRFTPDLRAVIVAIRVNKDVAPYIDERSEFWIVRPQVTARGVTGLGTVLGGVYLEGSWDSTPGTATTEFKGLSDPPLVRQGSEGLQFILRATEGGRLQAGAPIVYRGVDVGYIDTPKLAPDGNSVTANAFVQAPHDQLITDATRFWSASGFSVRLGAGGLSLNVASVAALLEGGVTFDNVIPTGEPVTRGAVFDVYDDEPAARSDVQTFDSASGVAFSAFFHDSLAGLPAGADVTLEGLVIGKVTGTAVVQDPEGGTGAVRVRADFSLSPERLGLPADADAPTTQNFLDQAIAKGLRARLASQGLLGQSLKVELVSIPSPPPMGLDRTAVPAPAIPTTDPVISDFSESAGTLLTRLQNLPLEGLVQGGVDLLANINQVVASPSMREAPRAVVELIDETRALIGSDEVRSTISAASAALGTLDQIMTQVNDSPALPALLTALTRADDIAASIQRTVDGLPQLLTDARDMVANAAQLPLGRLAEQASDLVASADRLISSDQVAALPRQLSDALGNLQGASAHLRDLAAEVSGSGAVENLLAAMNRTSSIAASIDETAAGLPDLVTRIDGLMARAQTLPIEELGQNANAILAEANTILGSDAAAALPETLNGALVELAAAAGNVATITDRLTEGPAMDSLAAALARTDSIAANIDTAAQGLPQLLDDIEALAAKANDLPLDDLVNSANRLVNSAEALVSSDDTAQVPAALRDALDQLAATLGELREGGAVTNMNDALASASQAADAIAEAARGLPELSQRLDGLIAQAEGVLAAYGTQSDFNTQTISALRDLRDAARAVTSLARTIERKPNALIIGR